MSAPAGVSVRTVDVSVTGLSARMTDSWLKLWIEQQTSSRVQPTAVRLSAETGAREAAAVVTVPVEHEQEMLQLNGVEVDGRCLAVSAIKPQPSFAAPSPAASSSSPSSSASTPALAAALQCPVCYEQFDLQLHLPQLVHASHTVCAACIDHLMLVQQSSLVRCPLCQTEVNCSTRLSNTVVCDLLQALALQPPQPQQAADDDSSDDDDEKKEDGQRGKGEENKKNKKKKKKKNNNKKKNKASQHQQQQQPGDSADSALLSDLLKQLPAASAAPSPAPPSAAAAPLSSVAGPPDVYTPASPADVCLTNRVLFPAFDGLPSSDVLNEDWYTRKGQMRCPKVHWTFAGEILQLMTFVRFGVRVADRDGKEIPIYFYTPVDREQFRIGFTVLVRYAEVHYFMDQQVGLRIDHPQFVKVLPMRLTNLTLFDQGRAEKPDNDRQHGVYCQRCNRTPAPSRCAACKTVDYCSKECQTANWASHKPSCRLWKQLQEVHELPHGLHAAQIPGSSNGAPNKVSLPFQNNVAVAAGPA
jgi:hypothetical protein